MTFNVQNETESVLDWMWNLDIYVVKDTTGLNASFWKEYLTLLIMYVTDSIHVFMA